MKFDSTTPRADATIAGRVFKIAIPFAEGHILTASEAGALNQLVIENTRNNFASKVRTSVENAALATGILTKNEKGEIVGTMTAEQAAALTIDVAALQTELDTYLSEYEFGVRRGGGQILDPIEKEAHSIAEDLIKKALINKGTKLKDFPKEEMKRLVTEVLADDGKGAAIRKKAGQVVKARQSIAADELGIVV